MGNAWSMNDIEVKCRSCGKLFNKTPEWGWWYKSKIMCSYHCMRDMERLEDQKRPKRSQEYIASEMGKPFREPMTAKKRAQILREVRSGKSYEKIAKDNSCGTSIVGQIARAAGIYRRAPRNGDWEARLRSARNVG